MAYQIASTICKLLFAVWLIDLIVTLSMYMVGLHPPRWTILAQMLCVVIMNMCATVMRFATAPSKHDN